ncbi:MAG TPA: hypothetical protein VFD57_00460, partial [Clostridia bacterium]|nr:hypothetical protein [Clostridia bacterium]
MVAKKQSGLLAYLRSMNFNKKISLFLITTILATTIAILVITSVSAGVTITSKSSEMAMRHIESIANNLDVALKDFNDIAMLLISDPRILRYAKSEKGIDNDYMKLSNDSYDTMVYIKNTKSVIDYISLIKYNDNT